MVGTSLSHYRITRALGSGGMGEVYAAEDTKLRRHVAVKVLPPVVADHPERRQRLEREARAVAALNHPNIVTIYSIEQVDGHLFLTMELVHGRPLSELIPPGGLPLDQLLTLAIPIADAVSAAHQQGVIHRDLKPDNIMVTDDGRPKVLDFGIARLTDVVHDTDAVTTVAMSRLTGEMSVIGTVAYMSPEQAEGRNVDHRSDIFSLGIALYEMATGGRPFKGDTAVSVLSSIVKDAPPPITAVNPGLPGELARIVRRCLTKDPARRYQTAADVRNDLQELKQEVDAGHGVKMDTSRAGVAVHWREWIAWTVAGLLAVAAALGVLARPSVSDPPREVWSLLAPANIMLTDGEAPQISPDGRVVAFVATDDSGRTLLYVRDRGSLAAQPLPGTDDATQPFWSPDSRSIGFFAGGQLKRVSVSGGRPQTLATASVPRGGSWNSSDVILFVPHPEQPPHTVSAAGGAATPVPADPGARRWFPSFLPDGNRYIYLAFRAGVAEGLRVAAVDSSEFTPVVQSSTAASYIAPGFLAFRRDEALVAQRFNPDTLQLQDAPVTLAEQVSFNPITLQTLFSASSDGVLAYLEAGRGWQLTWFDRLGRRLASAGTIGGYNSLCLSSDGERVVYDSAEPRSGNVDLYSLNLMDGTTSRLTFHPATDFYAACSPSTDDVVFASPREAAPVIYRLTTSEPGGEELVHAPAMPTIPTQWSRHGHHIVYSAFSQKTSWDIWVLPPNGDEAFAYLATDAEEQNGQISPNGRWMAYTSGQAGTYEVHVQPFPATGARWQVSRGGGYQPQWDPQGKRLFYISRDKKLMAVDVDASGPTFVQRASRVLIDTRVGGWERTHQGNPYAITANGERLLVANAGEERLPITMMLNWPSLVTSGQE